MGKKNFEAQLEALDRLGEQPVETWTEPLRAALRLRYNYVVAKAAEMAGRQRIAELLSDLLAAYDRFFDDPVKIDPQCWAKNALSRALAALELQDSQPFLRGLKHFQWEPVWGGRSDTAGTLRSTCAHALVQCREVSEPELLRHLVSALTDADKNVRVEVARAIEQLDSPSSSLLLRLRADIGGSDPDLVELFGVCYAGVLRLEGNSALSWVAKFLATEDDAAGEAALAIAATHAPEAFTILKERWQKAEDPWFSSALLSAIALTRQSEATDFLLKLVTKEDLRADQALEALLRSMPSDEMIEQVRASIQGNRKLEKVFADNRSTGPR